MPKKGFTLIEMLIVIAIISILASVFLVGLRGFRGSAYDARRTADIQRISSYLELYYTKYRCYPGGSIPSTSCNVSNAQVSWNDLTTALTSANIGISKIPNDPISGRDYAYAVMAGGQGYVLRAEMPESNYKGLDEDIDGSVYGLSCGSGGVGDDLYFCIQF